MAIRRSSHALCLLLASESSPVQAMANLHLQHPSQPCGSSSEATGQMRGGWLRADVPLQRRAVGAAGPGGGGGPHAVPPAPHPGGRLHRLSPVPGRRAGLRALRGLPGSLLPPGCGARPPPAPTCPPPRAWQHAPMQAARRPACGPAGMPRSSTAASQLVIGSTCGSHLPKGFLAMPAALLAYGSKG